MDRIWGYAEDLPFGGLNVVICGDFHQFPPVCSRKTAPLYWPASMDDSNEENVGSKLYSKFNKVVILKDQVRVTDIGWLELLRHAHHGTCSADHLLILQSLLLGSCHCLDTDFTCRPWSNTVLVTPQHSVCNQWNIAASKENSIAMKTQLYVSYAEDTIQNQTLTLREQIALEIKGNVSTGPKDDRSRLSDRLLLAVGLKVMVTHNIDTSHQIANGA